MAARETLTNVLELEELHRDTAITRSVKVSAQQLLTLDEEKVHIERLVTKLKDIYNGMLRSVNHCRLVTTRREKL